MNNVYFSTYKSASIAIPTELPAHYINSNDFDLILLIKLKAQKWNLMYSGAEYVAMFKSRCYSYS